MENEDLSAEAQRKFEDFKTSIAELRKLGTPEALQLARDLIEQVQTAAQEVAGRMGIEND